jgi:glycine/D-amino acid oxidase-like deaminating enzyme
MKRTTSPWTDQLSQKRYSALNQNITTDICIIGGGISGLLTAWYALKHTNLSITILEADKCFWGATGHNAGHVVSYFERPLYNIAAEFGDELTVKAQKDLYQAFDQFNAIMVEAKINIPYQLFKTYKGIFCANELQKFSKEIAFKKKHGLKEAELLFTADAQKMLPPKLQSTGTVTDCKTLEEKSVTNNSDILAVISAEKGCINSALFCEKLLEHALRTFQNRLQVFEKSPVTEIKISKRKVAITTQNGDIVSAKKMVLCTNGYTNFLINHTSDAEAEYQIKNKLKGTIGSMLGWKTQKQEPANALVYYCGDTEDNGSHNKDLLLYEVSDYVYTTTRTYENFQLHTIGGIENLYPTKSEPYQYNMDFDDKIQASLHQLNQKYYKAAPKNSDDYQYHWHGLMGYTNNFIRCIGLDPQNERLMYNLGCNGVGILPSVHGGYKISQYLNNIVTEPSIFDPV